LKESGMTLRLAVLLTLSCIVLTAAGLLRADEDAAPPEGVDVQTRGPVHEAYAEATNTRGVPGVIVNRQPPPAVEESPPEDKPEGDNVVWIPGYWSWDDETKDFMWISGFWRDEPPGRDWVPGEWQKVEGGYQWGGGYWAVEGQTEQEYLPPPPDSLDRGPTVLAPTPESVYVPGNWMFQVNRYVWRPGVWVPPHPGWVWPPASYKWTPAGYLSVPGYWDRPLGERGLLFAPVRFNRALLARPGFEYRPSYVVQPDFLLGSLFVRANTRKYYFGDYFEPAYRKTFVPWVDYRVNRVNYDANYAYYRAAYARHGNWDRNLRGLYQARYENVIPRPPRNLVQQTRVVNNFTANKTVNNVVHKNVNITNVQNVTVVQPIRKVKNVQVTGLSSLANLRPEEAKKAPIHRELRVERARNEHLLEERRQAQRYAALAQERRAKEGAIFSKRATTTTTAKTPAATAPAPVRVRYEVPKTAAAPRTRREVKLPPPPAHHVAEPKSTGKQPAGKQPAGKQPAPKKDKDKP